METLIKMCLELIMYKQKEYPKISSLSDLDLVVFDHKKLLKIIEIAMDNCVSSDLLITLAREAYKEVGSRE